MLELAHIQPAAAPPSGLLAGMCLDAEKIASGKNFCKTRTRRRNFYPQPVAEPQENTPAYDNTASGPTIYAYTGGNPIRFIDRLGLNASQQCFASSCTSVPVFTWPSPVSNSGGGMCTANTNTGSMSTPTIFSRPAGVPDNWIETPTRTPGGVQWTDPNNPGNYVRVMPGNPNSPYPNSQQPYVRWQANGKPLDVNGQPLPTAKTPEAHIPLEDYPDVPLDFFDPL